MSFTTIGVHYGESQLITTVNNITKALDRGLQTDIIFLDLFDKVPHHHLCNRLSFYGIRGKILNGYKTSSLTDTNRLS